MEKRLIGENSRRYADTELYYEVVGCAGKTDEEIKKSVDYKTEDESFWAQGYDKDFNRVSDDVATFTHIAPFLD